MIDKCEWCDKEIEYGVADTVKPKKPKRKELMREIATLKETLENLENYLATEDRRIVTPRIVELEQHLNKIGHEATLYRKIIRECNIGTTTGELFRKYFGKDIYEYDFELTPEETAKVFDNK